MAPPLSTAIPEARWMRESSKESSGVPLDSNLWTKPEPGSAKKTFPSESAANAAGVSSFPGPWPLSPHAFRNSKGGSCNGRSEEHTSELQSHLNLVCRLLLEKKK